MTALDRPSDDPLQQALALAAGGLRVHPIRPGGKHPPMQSWQHAATTDPKTITNWFTGLYRGYGVGIAMGLQPDGRRIFALDIDEHGVSGFDTLHELQAKHGKLPDTVAAVTGGGGAHLLFDSGDLEVTNGAAGQVGPGLDVRGQGGQIVVAPSIHPDTGHPYHWEAGYAPWEIEIARAPAWLLELARPPELAEPRTSAPAASTSMFASSPADQLRAAWDWPAELTKRGWEFIKDTSEGQHWARPGKDKREGNSAVLHDEHLVIFSTDASMQPYWDIGKRGSGCVSLTPFAFLAASDHGGDMSAATRALQPAAPSSPSPSPITLSQADGEGDPLRDDGGGFVNWADLFAGVKTEDPIVENLLFKGRWTGLAAEAKSGKSTFAVWLATELALGRDPFTGADRDPVHVIYLDAEMGRLDMHEHLEKNDRSPVELERLHYHDAPPKLDTPEGGAWVMRHVEHWGAEVVIIDGLNGVVTGAEKDDTTWRALFDCTIAPLKRAGLAILSLDNMGKDKALGPRGSSVKLDKPDAIPHLERLDHGVRLETKHRRTAAYLEKLELSISGDIEHGPFEYRRTTGLWPTGTAETARLLDELGLPKDAGRDRARVALKAGGHKIGNGLLTAALRFRKTEGRSELAVRPSENLSGQPRTGATNPLADSPDSPGYVVPGQSQSRRADPPRNPFA